MYMYICICVYIYVHIYIYTHVYMCIYLYIHIISLSLSLSIYLSIYIHTHTHIYNQYNIYTCTRAILMRLRFTHYIAHTSGKHYERLMANNNGKTLHGVSDSRSNS